MKIKILNWKHIISKTFSESLGLFFSKESLKINPLLEYLTINLTLCPEAKVEILRDTIIMKMDRLGLMYNLDKINYRVILYWKYKNGELPLYPHEEIEEKDIQFWIEGLDEFADEIRERFKSKPEPTLIEGYSFRVEMWKWDGVDAMFEITIPEEYFKQTAQIIDDAFVNWNELFEKGKKRHPIHYVGALEKSEANRCEIHVNTGYAGISALKHIFKYLHKAKIPIEKIEF